MYNIDFLIIVPLICRSKIHVSVEKKELRLTRLCMNSRGNTVSQTNNSAMKHKQFYPKHCLGLKIMCALIVSMGLSTVLSAQKASQFPAQAAALQYMQSSLSATTSIHRQDKDLLQEALNSPEFAQQLSSHQGDVLLMMHGLDFEPINDLIAHGKKVHLLSKSEVLERNPSLFFILNEIQRGEGSAYINLAMHPNFNGTYEECISASMTFAKSNGNWIKQEVQTKTTH